MRGGLIPRALSCYPRSYTCNLLDKQLSSAHFGNNIHVSAHLRTAQSESVPVLACCSSRKKLVSSPPRQFCTTDQCSVPQTGVHLFIDCSFGSHLVTASLSNSCGSALNIRGLV